MFSLADRREQRGLASLEFVLVLPILIVITFLAVAMVKLGHLRLDMQISARSNTWWSAIGWSLFPRINDNATYYLKNTEVSHPFFFVSADAGDDFHREADTTNERFQALHNATITPTITAASTEFTAVRALGRWTIDVREQHAVVAQPIWERTHADTRIGYDQYLKDRLRSHHLVVRLPGTKRLADIGFDFGDLYSGYASDAVPDVFPRAQ